MSGHHRPHGHHGAKDGPFRPFPKLWEVFADDKAVMAILDDVRSFDTLSEASRRLAVNGLDSSREYLLLTKSPVREGMIARHAPAKSPPRSKPTEEEVEAAFAGAKSPPASPSQELIDLVNSQNPDTLRNVATQTQGRANEPDDGVDASTT